MTAKKGSTNGAVAATSTSIPEIVEVDVNMLTIGEIEAAEALAQVPITYAMDPEKPKGEIFRAMACVVKQRTDPGFTYDDAAKVIVSMAPGTPVPPTNGRGSSTRSRSRSTSPSSRGRTSTA
jgi:hypothetical protein